MSYTEGPWRKYRAQVRSKWSIRDRRGRYVVSAVFEESDATLIAAAPDLLETIKEYLAWGAMTGSDRDYFEKKFGAMIAKAEGR